jgi:hypothetical protein
MKFRLSVFFVGHAFEVIFKNLLPIGGMVQVVEYFRPQLTLSPKGILHQI